MDNNTSYISTNELNQINSMLKDDTRGINEIYEKKILLAIRRCEEDLKVSGLDYSEVENTFKTVFQTVTEQLDGLTNLLEKDIIPKYEATAASITKLFNQDFASQMTDCLNSIKQN